MQQDKLWYEDAGAALSQAVIVLGGCAAVGKRLWPSKPVKQAEQKCANCLNPAHDWKFDLDEIVSILRWAREEGAHFAMHKICEQAGYGEPQLAPLKTHNQLRAERMERLLAEFRHLADEEAAEGNSDPARKYRDHEVRDKSQRDQRDAEPLTAGHRPISSTFSRS